MPVDPKNLAELRKALSDSPDALEVLTAFDSDADDEPAALIEELLDRWASSQQAGG
jgi:hypothetical protein